MTSHRARMNGFGDRRCINAKFHQALGGVGRNMAEALVRLGVRQTTLVSAVGNDLAGRLIGDELRRMGLDTSSVAVVDEASTGSYCAFFDSRGEIDQAAGAMHVHDHIDVALLSRPATATAIAESTLCVIDADLPVESIRHVCERCRERAIPVWFNPTDLNKCTRIVDAHALDKITYMSPNTKELFTIFAHMLRTTATATTTPPMENAKELDAIRQKYDTRRQSSCKDIEAIELSDMKHMLKFLLRFVPYIVVSRGSSDLILACAHDLSLSDTDQHQHQLSARTSSDKPWRPQMITFPVLEIEAEQGDGSSLVNVTGAGDSTSSGIIAGMLRKYDLCSTIYNGLLSAKMALATRDNVSPHLHTIDERMLSTVVARHRTRIQKILL